MKLQVAKNKKFFLKSSLCSQYGQYFAKLVHIKLDLVRHGSRLQLWLKPRRGTSNSDIWDKRVVTPWKSKQELWRLKSH